MINKFKRFSIILFCLALCLPVVVFAANDVTVESGLSIVLPSDSSSYTIGTNTTVQSFTVNNSTIDFVVEANSVINLTYAGNKNFGVSDLGICSQTSQSCSATDSSITITCPSNMTEKTVTITPSGTCSASPSSGGGGGGAALTDTSAPTISNTKATASNTQSVISWNTDESSISWVVYGLTTAYGSEKKTISYVSAHSLTLTDLTPGTTYHYQIKSKDSAGNTSTYTDKTFTTSGTAPATPTTPVVTTPTTPETTTPVTTVTTPPATTETTVVTTPTTVTYANPASSVTFSKVNAYSHQPGASLKFTYQYKNETAKTVKGKLVRELLNSKGKAVKSSTASINLKPNALFTRNVSEAMSKSLAPGEYTVKIKITDLKNKVLDENSFKVAVEKLKSKYFVMGSLSSDTDIAFDKTVYAKVKSNVKTPVSLKLKYSYTNNTAKKHTVKMTRELIGPNGKVLASKTGKWVMKVGEKDSTSFTQYLGSNLSAGTYMIRLRAYDWTTKELLTENSVGFNIELK